MTATSQTGAVRADARGVRRGTLPFEERRRLRMERHAAYRKKRYTWLREQHLCTRCKAPQTPTALCKRCTERRRLRKHERRRPQQQSDVPVVFDTMRTRLARAMRWLDWSIASEIFEAVGRPLDQTERNTGYQAVSRMVLDGFAERRIRERTVFEYRLTPKGKAYADKARKARLEPWPPTLAECWSAA